MAALARWIAANAERACVSSALEPASDRSANARAVADRSIYAVAAIAAGDVLVTLRAGAFLNGSTWLRDAETALSAADASALQAQLAKLQPSGTVLTALALLAEKACGELSAFAGYIEQLPTRVPLPLAWSSQGKSRLKSTAAFPIMDDELVRSVFDRFAQPLTYKFPSLWAMSDVTFDAFRWAFSIVSSRAFSGDNSQEPTLLPVIDMGNHEPNDPAAVIQKDQDGGYSLVALRAVDADAPVTVSYGELSSAQLLCRYGFTLLDVTPSDSILLSSAHVRIVFAQLTAGGSAEGALAQLEYLAQEDAAQVADADTEASAPEAKRRKLFAAAAEPVQADDVFSFALHSDAAREFGLADGLMGFVFAQNLPMDALYDVLTVLLQHKDKAYSALLTTCADASSAAAVETEKEEARLAHSLVALERQVCRRILLGLTGLEEDSDEPDDDGDDDEQEEAADDEDD